MTVQTSAPDWAVPGATAYLIARRGFGDITAWKVTVERLTATQVIVKHGDREVRYRIKDMREVGRDSYGSNTLVGPDDPAVLEHYRQQAARAAMKPLANVISDAAVGARIYSTRDLPATFALAKQIRDAAQHAVTELAKLVNEADEESP